jgi:Fe-S-cluster-containing hydrogenase component 2
MSNVAELILDAGSVHDVEVDETRCNGCVLCMKVCPTKAIRVKNRVACVEGVGIDCENTTDRLISGGWRDTALK